MTRTDTALRSGSAGTPFLELLVPVLSFGGTLAGIFIWSLGLHFGIQYAAIGSVLGSCILAYLAWIRQKKDIVSLTTPIYAIIFFVVPSDYLPGIVLQLLFAAGLTVLLVRLKYRFGAVPAARPEGDVLAGPLRQYVDGLAGSFPFLSAEAAHHAADVFCRFSMGEYREAGRVSDLLRKDVVEVPEAGVLTRALSVVSEQAGYTEQSLDLPETFLTFDPGQCPKLAHTDLPVQDREQEYCLALYNALLYLYAAAWDRSPADRDRLLRLKDFALKLAS
ncbi:MAG: hypothetical protein ABSB80_12470 [Methanoregula sp.]|jgi:hypothetical protein|uniref:hypothetical protein n=1 Tax=Methanoregula sp. TaxID=2052170 RepID=UPI003D0B2C07